jgi:hypothetical protein
MPCDSEGRDQGDTSVSQRMPKITINLAEVKREAWNRFSLITLRRNES